MQLHRVSMSELHDTGQTTLLQVLEQFTGGSTMSHHVKFIVNGEDRGHVRITNDGEILSIWDKTKGILFVPEKVK